VQAKLNKNKLNKKRLIAFANTHANARQLARAHKNTNKITRLHRLANVNTHANARQRAPAYKNMHKAQLAEPKYPHGGFSGGSFDLGMRAMWASVRA